MTQRALLLVEDDGTVRYAIRRFFGRRGYEVLEAETCAAAERILLDRRPDVAIVDYSLPDGDGLTLLRTVRGLEPAVPVVILTGHGTIELAVRAIKEGAEQFLTKPVELPALKVVVERLIEVRRHRQVALADRSRQEQRSPDPFLGESQTIRRLATHARRVADASSPVLIQGETGSGKGLLAAWLHRNSPRAEEPFVDLNCAGLSRDLLESELFGYEKGAFTGATADKQGLFEVAGRGSVFLDEIGDIDPQVAPRLLKVLEEGRFRRLGAVRDRRADIRLLAASNRDLGRAVEEGSFRSDLYYRVSTIVLTVPPLRERGRDVILLARALLAHIGADMGRPEVGLKPDAEQMLLSHRWPGNVRELRNVLERAVLLGDRGVLCGDDLARVSSPMPPASASRITLLEAERRHIQVVLDLEGGDVRRAASILGLSKSALYQKLRKHGLRPSKGR